VQATPKAAIFAFELIDVSIAGELTGRRGAAAGAGDRRLRQLALRDARL
jgi:hypothetical protein